MTELTWIGCPQCGHDPSVLRELPAYCLMQCHDCGWFGKFSECWKVEVAVEVQ